MYDNNMSCCSKYEDIEKHEKRFVFFYNVLLRRDYQDYYRVKNDGSPYRFINHKDHKEMIKRATECFLRNKGKLKDIYGENAKDKMLMFVFVASLFYIFNENPPEIFQYYAKSVENKIIRWIKQYSDCLYDIYDSFGQVGWLNKTTELIVTKEMIKEYNQKQKEYNTIKTMKPSKLILEKLNTFYSEEREDYET